MADSHKAAFVPAEGIYMLNHSVGRPPVTAREAYIAGFLEPWENAGEEVWPRWLESIEGFRAALAELLNTQAGCFCPQVNLSSALTKVLHSLPIRDGRDTIVYTEQDFPSIAFVLQQAQKAGYQLRAIPAGTDILDPGSWEKCLGDDVAFLLLTHVFSNTGEQAPVEEITAAARAMGVLSIVDIAQSVGCVPIDLEAWQADFVIGSCVKWLCGGPGAGFLWVDPARVPECEPVDVGWFSHENPFEFDIHNFRYAGDAMRFWGGTPSVQPYVIAANSIRLQLQIGTSRIREHNLALTQMLLDSLDEDKLVTPVQARQRGGTVVVRFGDRQQDTIEERMRKAGVQFDVRSTGIRLSPHIYNDADEIGIVIGCLAL